MSTIDRAAGGATKQRTALETAVTLKNVARVRALIKPKEQLVPLVKRAEDLLVKTPPNGPEYLQLLRHILDRERLWRCARVPACP